jgi:hypothetical protein
MDAGRRLSALTHGNPAACEGTAIFHELLRVALDGRDPVAAVPDTLAAADRVHRGRYEAVLAAHSTPEQATKFNGAVWPCLGSAAGRSAAPIRTRLQYGRLCLVRMCGASCANRASGHACLEQCRYLPLRWFLWQSLTGRLRPGAERRSTMS